MQSSANGHKPLRPFEESWRLISKLRKNLPPDKLRAIVNRCGLPSSVSSGPNRDLSEPLVPVEKSINSEDAWLTMADIKLEAVKAVCYDVAMNGFARSQGQIEAACIYQLKKLCETYGKVDTQPSETWKAVARDVMDTIGSFEDEYVSSEDSKTLDCADHNYNAQHYLVEPVSAVYAEKSGSSSSTSASTRSKDEIEKLQHSMTALVDLFKTVKLENESKDEEMRAMKNKMAELERALNSNTSYGKGPLLKDVVTSTSAKTVNTCSESQKQAQLPSESGSPITSATADSEKHCLEARSAESTYSPRYIYSNDFSEPSHGVVVPDWIKTKQEKIAWLMEHDVAFRRGRQRWEAQQKRHQANLHSQEVNRERRRQEREKSKQPLPGRSNPRFAFKNSRNEDDKSKTRTRGPTRKYFEGPRRKTCSSLKELPPDNSSDVLKKETEKTEEKSDQFKLQLEKSLSEGSAEDFKPRTAVKLTSTVAKSGKNSQFSQRRKTWCDFTPANPENAFYKSQQLVYPQVHGYGIQQSRSFQEWRDEPDQSCNPYLSTPVFFDAPYSYTLLNYVNQTEQPNENRSNSAACYDGALFQPCGPLPQYTVTPGVQKCPAPPLLFMDRPQFVLGLPDTPPQPVISPVTPFQPQLYRNPLNDVSPPRDLLQGSESPPYMSTSMDTLSSKASLSKSKVDADVPSDTEKACPVESSKKKVVFKGIYQPPFKRKNLQRESK